MGEGLERFVEAQEGTYEKALSELRNGKKLTHWMWYTFPQLHGLGHSEKANFYAISGLGEAKEYLAHPILGLRLKELSEVLLGLEENDPIKIMGYVDAIKLCSSMTLFHLAVPEETIFRQMLDKFFGGRLDKISVGILERKREQVPGNNDGQLEWVDFCGMPQLMREEQEKRASTRQRSYWSAD